MCEKEKSHKCDVTVSPGKDWEICIIMTYIVFPPIFVKKN